MGGLTGSAIDIIVFDNFVEYVLIHVKICVLHLSIHIIYNTSLQEVVNINMSVHVICILLLKLKIKYCVQLPVSKKFTACVVIHFFVTPIP